MAEQDTQDARSDMQRREIKLADGRYLIFYTFDEAPTASTEGSGTKRPEPLAEPEASEERDV